MGSIPLLSTLCARTGLPVLALELSIHLLKQNEKSKSTSSHPDGVSICAHSSAISATIPKALGRDEREETTTGRRKSRMKTVHAMLTKAEAEVPHIRPQEAKELLGKTDEYANRMRLPHLERFRVPYPYQEVLSNFAPIQVLPCMTRS